MEAGSVSGARLLVRCGFTETTRCLDFRARFDSLEEAALACEEIGSYNKFDGWAVAEMLRSLDSAVWGRRVSVGREGSPVLYFEYHADLLPPHRPPLDHLLAGLGADEVEFDDSLLVLRAWWD